MLAETNSCLPAELGRHASGSCEGGPPSAPPSIFHPETPTAPGGYALVYYHVSVLSLSLTAEDTVVKTGHVKEVHKTKLFFKLLKLLSVYLSETLVLTT